MLTKKHQYQLSHLTGVLTYSLDQGPKVRLKFSHQVQLTIFTNDDDGESNSNVDFDNGDENVRIVTNETLSSTADSNSGESHMVSDIARNQDTVLKEKKDKHLFKDRHSNKKARSKKQTFSRVKQRQDQVADEVSSKFQNANENSFLAMEGRSVAKQENFSEKVGGSKNEMHKPNVTKCQYCHTEFDTVKQFYDHRRAETGRHVCATCGKVEPFEAYLIVHMQKHKVKIEEKAAESMIEGEMSHDKGKEKNKKKISCNICGLVVSSKDSLKIHTMTHTGEHAYRCCVCSEKFSCLSKREFHMDTHRTVLRFRCVACNQRFSSKAELSKHKLSHQIKCDLCSQVFPNKTTRSAHLRVAHPDSVLRCDQCPALFCSSEALLKHKQYHKTRRKKQCPTCGTVVYNLEEHMLVHSSKSEDRMYVCDKCPMSYLRRNNLERHMRTHTGERPFACDHCPKRFRSNGMLSKHLLTHTLERPFQCGVCGKRCALRSNLAIHMRTHSSTRRFSCPTCSQTFNHKNSLDGHIRNKHPAQPQQHLPVTAAFNLQPTPSDISTAASLDGSQQALNTRLALSLPLSPTPNQMSESLLQDRVESSVVTDKPVGVSSSRSTTLLSLPSNLSTLSQDGQDSQQKQSPVYVAGLGEGKPTQKSHDQAMQGQSEASIIQPTQNVYLTLDYQNNS